MTSGNLKWRRHVLGRSYVIVDPSGTVLCCPFFSQYHLGNLEREEVSKVWGNARHRSFIRAQTKKQIPLCRQCILSIERSPNMLEAFAKRFSQFRKSRKDASANAR